MRRILILGFSGLFVLTVFAAVGCDGSKEPKTPPSMMEIPKNGPVAAGGGGGGGGKASTNVVPEKKNTTD